MKSSPNHQKSNKCPKCQCDEIHRDEVDIGVGIQCGPWGCPACGWSEDPSYDLSEGRDPVDEKGGAIDQYGGYHPPGSSMALAHRLARQADQEAAMPSTKIPFNINDRVYVKLTAHGRKVIGDRLQYVTEDKDGWSEWQLWELMQYLGEHTGMGAPLVFETNIQLEIKNRE